MLYKMFYKQIEQHPHNAQACVLACYFETQEEAEVFVRDSQERELLQNPLSIRAGLVRAIQFDC